MIVETEQIVEPKRVQNRGALHCSQVNSEFMKVLILGENEQLLAIQLKLVQLLLPDTTGRLLVLLVVVILLLLLLLLLLLAIQL